MTELKFTGERVVPSDMAENDITLLEHLARYNFALPFCKGKDVLDCACGSGYGTKMLGADGVDVSAEAVEYAEKTYGIIAVVGDLEIATLGGPYEVITSFETIEHLENPENFLVEVAKNSDQFIFSIPINNASPFHKKVYTLEQAKALINLHFKNVVWFEQIGTDIIGLQSSCPVFLIGVASN